jgi:hypothetical protein
VMFWLPVASMWSAVAISASRAKSCRTRGALWVRQLSHSRHTRCRRPQPLTRLDAQPFIMSLACVANRQPNERHQQPFLWLKGGCHYSLACTGSGATAGATDATGGATCGASLLGRYNSKSTRNIDFLRCNSSK